MSIKRLRFYDQTFPLYRSNVCVSMIKRFYYVDQTFSLYRYNENFNWMIATFVKIKLLLRDTNILINGNAFG